MKALTGFIGAALAATAIAGSSAAQEPPTQPNPPQIRQRLHAPGTGLPEGVIPQRQRIGGRGWMGAGGGMYAPRHLLAQKESLGLTDDQVAQLEELDTQFSEQRNKAAEELGTLRADLRNAWNSEDPDLAAVRDKTKAVLDAEEALQLSRIDAEARAKTVLNQEQIGKARSFVQGYQMGVGARRGGMQGRMAPGGRGQRGGRGMPGSRHPWGMRGPRPVG